MKISAVVLTRNEARSLKRCLKGLDFCEEVVVVDDFSQDNTRQMAAKLGAVVFSRSLKGNFAAQRNFGLKKAKHAWVLFVDADERVTPALAGEVSNLLPCRQAGKSQISNVTGFYFKRKDYFLGRWLEYGETGNVKLLRLARKNAGKWQRRVHEFWAIEKGRVGKLKNPLLHYPHQNINLFLEAINQYTTLDAQEFRREGKKFQIWQMSVYPLAKFFLNYFWRLGFLDGLPGLAMAFLMSYHSLITRIKLWEIEKGELNVNH